MIKISVISYNNEAPAIPLSAIFDENGGTLGRSDDNHFVLPDPKRYVSRLQASIKSDGVFHQMVNLSQANPILINGQKIEPGQEYDLNAGDEIRVGLYLLRVESYSSECQEGGALVIPFVGMPSRFDESLPARASEVVHLRPEMQVIPNDFDPFSLPSQSQQNTPDPLAGLSNNNITLESLKHGDANLFNLTALDSSSNDESLTNTSSLKMSRSSEADPLALFSSDSAFTKKSGYGGFNGEVVANHSPELNAHFVTPQLNLIASEKQECESSGVVPKQSPFSLVRKEPVSASTLLYETQDSVNTTNADQANGHELMLAFLRGTGMPQNAISVEVTPEFMEMLGKLLATSIQGTVELIASRTMVKREVKADMTIIVPKKNNPLKFLPDGQTVLMQLLRERLPGFMEPVEAIQDAYVDLCAHQIGVVAGMRSAMAEMLERFNPELLEKKTKDRSLFDAMLPANRKARMWDRYTELFEEIRLNSQDDFHALFGKAFVAAYEMEIERFRNEKQND